MEKFHSVYKTSHSTENALSRLFNEFNANFNVNLYSINHAIIILVDKFPKSIDSENLVFSWL